MIELQKHPGLNSCLCNWPLISWDITFFNIPLLISITFITGALFVKENQTLYLSTVIPTPLW